MPEENQNQGGAAAPPSDGDGKAAPPAPAYMTQEQFNKAMTAREKRFEERLQKMVAGSLAPLMERLPPAASDDDDEADEPAPPTAAPAQSSKPSKAEVDAKKARKGMEELRKQMEAECEERKQERERFQREEAKAATKAALSAYGCVQPDHALAVLEMRNLLRRSDSGELVFVSKTDYQGQTLEEEKGLEAGIKEWLSSPDGQLYLPPKGTQGSGSTGAGRPGNRKLTKDEAKEEALKGLVDAFRRGGPTY